MMARRFSAKNEIQDPSLPQKQRARWRFIGATVLALSAMIILPLALESEPRRPLGDVQITIPDRAELGRHNQSWPVTAYRSNQSGTETDAQDRPGLFTRESGDVDSSTARESDSVAAVDGGASASSSIAVPNAAGGGTGSSAAVSAPVAGGLAAAAANAAGAVANAGQSGADREIRTKPESARMPASGSTAVANDGGGSPTRSTNAANSADAANAARIAGAAKDSSASRSADAAKSANAPKSTNAAKSPTAAKESNTAKDSNASKDSNTAKAPATTKAAAVRDPNAAKDARLPTDAVKGAKDNRDPSGSARAAAGGGGPAVTGPVAALDSKVGKQGSLPPPMPERRADRNQVAASSPGGYVVQIGAFSNRKGANSQLDRAKKLGFKPYAEPYETKKGEWVRVRVGPYVSRDQAEEARARLRRSGIETTLIAP